MKRNLTSAAAFMAAAVLISACSCNSKSNDESSSTTETTPQTTASQVTSPAPTEASQPSTEEETTEPETYSDEENQVIIVDPIDPPPHTPLSETTTKLLDEVKDKEIEIYYFFTLASFDAHPNFDPSVFGSTPEYDSLYYTITDLQEYSNIKYIEAENPEMSDYTAELDPDGMLGIEGGDIVVKCGDNIKRINHSLFFTVEPGNTALMYNGENLIAGAIYSVTHGLPGVYTLTGHGESWTSDDHATYNAVIEGGGYKVDDIALDSAGALPDDASIVCLYAPNKDLSDKETEIINKYMDNGGSVMMLLAPSKTDGKFVNIESLLAEYGISMDYNIISDPDTHYVDESGKSDPYHIAVEYPKVESELSDSVNYMVDNGDYVAGISDTRSFSLLPESDVPNHADLRIEPIIVNIPDDNGKYSTVSEAMGGDPASKAEYGEKLSNVPLTFGYIAENTKTGGKLYVAGSEAMIGSALTDTYVSGTRMLTLFSNSWLFNSEIDMGIPAKRVK